MAALRQRFPWLTYGVIWVVILVFTLLPLVSMLTAAWIAEANGCALDEGSVHPCIVGGSDWGETLYGMGVMGWLMLVSIPAGGGAFIVWLIILIIHRIAWGKRQTEPSRP